MRPLIGENQRHPRAILLEAQATANLRQSFSVVAVAVIDAPGGVRILKCALPPGGVRILRCALPPVVLGPVDPSASEDADSAGGHCPTHLLDY
jgi:hypothetical protein